MRSGSTRGAALAALLCAVAVLLLGACGREVAGRETAASATASPAITGLRWTSAAPMRITGAELGTDRRTVTIASDVPSGPNPCVRGLKAVLTEPVANSVRVKVTYDSPSGDRRSGCTETTTAKTRVKLPEPLGNRTLVVGMSTVFTTEGAHLPALRLCGDLGCTPPATGCTAPSYEQALKQIGAPAHTYRNAEHCDGKWLVLDFSWRAGPACEDTTTPCNSHVSDRWFYKAGESGWESFFSTTTGGCQAVQDRQPAFPTVLCASLEPLSP